ncbi:MAG: hypothetical protein V2I63_06845, partial [Pseudomonadales bacterium]|nr:hypothetical protein [Pseudomonadales bacterium]
MIRTALTALTLTASTIAFAADAPLAGFDAAGAAAERALEADFVARLDAADQDAWLRELSERPHHVGSDRGRENAEWI